MYDNGLFKNVWYEVWEGYALLECDPPMGEPYTRREKAERFPTEEQAQEHAERMCPIVIANKKHRSPESFVSAKPMVELVGFGVGARPLQQDHD